MENNKPKENGKKPVPTVSTVLPTGDLVELVYDPKARRTALAVGSPEYVYLRHLVYPSECG